MGDLLLARSKTLFDSLLPVFTPVQQMRYSMKLCHFDVMAIHLRPMQMVAKSFFSSVQRPIYPLRNAKAKKIFLVKRTLSKLVLPPHLAGMIFFSFGAAFKG